MSFLLDRSKGKIKTGARFIREFVLNHQEYKQDSIVTNKIAFDLMSTIINLNNSPEELLTKVYGNKII